MRSIARMLGAGVVGGVLIGGVAGLLSPATANAEGPVLSGTYAVTTHYGTATPTTVAKFASVCGRCGGTVTADGVTQQLTWIGAGWQFTTVAGCGPQTTVYTPVADVDEIVQSFTLVGTFANPAVCAVVGPVTGTGNRISD